jgi:1,2-diacylglycerol 3-alpha-glucosyltransferase
MESIGGEGVEQTRMIVGQFNDSFQPITDGVAAVTRNYAIGLGKRVGPDGCSYVVTPAFPGYADQETGYQVLRYRSIPMANRPPYRIGFPQLDHALRKRLQDIPFDIVHAQCPFSAGKLALRIAKARQIPLVASFHTKYYEDILPVVHSELIAKKYLHSLMEIYHQADAVWTVNESTIDTLRAYGYQGPVHVVCNGTDLAKADPDLRCGEAAQRVIKEMAIEENVPLLFFIGQHIWQKNLRMLIDALRILKTRLQPASGAGRAFRMVFIGGGEAADELKELVKCAQLESEVSFLGVIRDREFVRGIYERADLLLFPSLYDTSALVLREAAAALCPFILIGGSTIAEGIQDGDNGFLSANDPAAFADTIVRAMADPERRKRVGLRAQQTLYRSWDTVVDEVFAEYQAVIKRKRK